MLCNPFSLGNLIAATGVWPGFGTDCSADPRPARIQSMPPAQGLFCFDFLSGVVLPSDTFGGLHSQLHPSALHCQVSSVMALAFLSALVLKNLHSSVPFLQLLSVYPCCLRWGRFSAHQWGNHAPSLRGLLSLPLPPKEQLLGSSSQHSRRQRESSLESLGFFRR